METILFVCTENKKRSKIAEAIFNHVVRKKNIEARAISAGTIPAQAVDSFVPELLTENGIKTQLKKPRKLTDKLLAQADMIISFGCLIPDMFPRDTFEEWLVDDPKTPQEYKFAFETIYHRVENLLRQRIS